MATKGDDADAPEVAKSTVRERIEEVVEADKIHGLTITRRQEREGEEPTVYCVLAKSTTWDRIDEDVDLDIPVLDIRTVVVDFEEDTVKTSDNGIWMPQEPGVAESLTQIMARATSDLSGNSPGEEPTIKSAVPGLDPDIVLEREIEEDVAVEGQHIERMERETGIDPKRGWGYGAPAPPEVHDVVEKLEEAGLPTDRFIRLEWGKKSPIERMNGDLDNGRPVEQLLGNYGICPEAEDSGLLLIDIDYPEEFPDVDVSETFEVSSPHGDDTQRHLWLRCDEKDKLFDEIGSWAVQSTDWGDMWIGDRYGVGPGSQLSEYGCNEGDHEADEAGGCEACEDESAGYYRTVNDAPIATIEADTILEILEASDGYNLRTGPNEVTPVEEHEEQEDLEEGEARCNSCDAIVKKEIAKTFAVAGETRYICRGGCDV